MDYHYQETVDWGIIKREWIAADERFLIIIEKHEEDRFTVQITDKKRNSEYYSYLLASGNQTWGSLTEAQEFAKAKLAEMAAF